MSPKKPLLQPETNMTVNMHSSYEVHDEGCQSGESRGHPKSTTASVFTDVNKSFTDVNAWLQMFTDLMMIYCTCGNRC